MEVHGRVGERRGRRLDIARRREMQRAWESCIAHGRVEFCEVTPIGLADDSKQILVRMRDGSRPE